MMLGPENSGKKQLETKIGDICVVRWSKPSGDYITNFYRPKEVSCKKTSPKSTQGAHEAGGMPRRVGCASHPRGGLVSLLICFLFSYFIKYSKRKKY